jgi:hypothetical protein
MGCRHGTRKAAGPRQPRGTADGPPQGSGSAESTRGRTKRTRVGQVLRREVGQLAHGVAGDRLQHLGPGFEARGRVRPQHVGHRLRREAGHDARSVRARSGEQLAVRVLHLGERPQRVADVLRHELGDDAHGRSRQRIHHLAPRVDAQVAEGPDLQGRGGGAGPGGRRRARRAQGLLPLAEQPSSSRPSPLPNLAEQPSSSQPSPLPNRPLPAAPAPAALTGPLTELARFWLLNSARRGSASRATASMKGSSRTPSLDSPHSVLLSACEERKRRQILVGWPRTVAPMPTCPPAAQGSPAAQEPPACCRGPCSEPPPPRAVAALLAHTRHPHLRRERVQLRLRLGADRGADLLAGVELQLRKCQQRVAASVEGGGSAGSASRKPPSRPRQPRGRGGRARWPGAARLATNAAMRGYLRFCDVASPTFDLMAAAIAVSSSSPGCTSAHRQGVEAGSARPSTAAPVPPPPGRYSGLQAALAMASSLQAGLAVSANPPLCRVGCAEWVALRGSLRVA